MNEIYKRILVVLFAFLAFSIFLLPHKDTDFGWHYRCGNQIIQEHKLCINNNFTYFLSDYKWANPTFIYDFTVALVFNVFSFYGLAVLGAFIGGTILLILYKNMKVCPPIRIFFILFAVMMSWSILSLGLRSQITTLLFYIITLTILLKSTTKPSGKFLTNSSLKLRTKLSKEFYLLPLLFLLWVNTHAGFFIGPIIFFLFIVDYLQKKIRQTKELKISKTDKAIFTIFISSVLITLINPFTYKVYEEVFRHWKVPLHTLIAEWVPPNGPQIILILILAVLLLFIKIQKARSLNEISTFEILILTLVTYLAITARRNLPIFYFSYILLIQDDIKTPSKYFTKYVYIGSIFILLAFGTYLGYKNAYNVYKFHANWNSYCNGGLIKMPCDDIDYFKGKKGNVYNTYEWGGFLIWQIPNMKLFIDGRMPAWIDKKQGVYESPYTTWLHIIQTRPGWQKKLDSFGTDYLFINNGTFLDILLKDNPEKYGYTQERRSKKAVIYKRIK